MTQTAIRDLTAWLSAAPPLADIAFTTDALGPAPGGGGVYPQGVEVLKRTENLCGGVTLRCKAVFLVRLVLPSAAAADNADRLLAVQRWVNSRRDHPRLGSAEPHRETLTAGEGRLEQAGAEGTDRYIVRLMAEFTDKEEPDEN